ncbi:MAG: 23S rRNA (uracil-5-)-methyltransferase RumA, partial [Clostridia bacterium]|nr:23S rRNA (uracil-5-)-methyltransferase RumA [Clostridia bacterium]
TIGQYAADKAARVIGVEIVADAVANAKENAKLNGLTNTEYYCGAAEEVALTLLKKGLKPDAIILDPPRKGCDRSLIETAAGTRAKKIVYISCKPSTLARDLKLFDGLGYKTVKIQPVDMFPGTAHVESVVLMSRKDK